MKKIVILGNSSAVIPLIDKVRQHDREAIITFIPLSEHLPYHRHSLVDFFNEKQTLDEVYCRLSEYFEENNVDVVHDKKIKRISFKRKYVALEDKSQIDFDLLIVTGTDNIKYAEFKGNIKNGVFRSGRLEDIISAIALLPIADTFVVQDQSFQALELAFALNQKGKEVLWINPSDQLLPDLIDEETATFLSDILEKSGIRIINQNKITEILGDADLKAIKLQSGKVYGCQGLFLDGGSVDMRLFKESELMMKNGICIDHQFQSNIEGIFALDEVCAFRLLPALRNTPIYSEAIDKQGVVVGSALMGEEQVYDIALNVNSFNLGDYVVTVMGRTVRGDQIEEFANIDPEKRVMKKVFVKDNRVIGAVLINAPELQDEIYQLIVQQDEVDDKITLIIGAQSVEPALTGNGAVAECDEQPEDEGTVGSSAEVADTAGGMS